MKMFSDCSDCVVCACAGGCLAGHGDDDFQMASEQQLRERLQTRRWAGRPENRSLTKAEIQKIRGALLSHYGVEET